jgi:hypothetical protein
MTDHDYYPYGNSSVQTAYVFPCFYGSDLSCFKVHAPTCPRDTIICLPDDKMVSAEAGRFASLSDFEFNLVDQFFKLVRIVVKTCLLLINSLNWLELLLKHVYC